MTIKEFKEDLNNRFGPGSFGCHEALHMSQFLSGSIVRALCIHPAISSNPEWKDMAERAATQLEELYKSISAAHMKT